MFLIPVLLLRPWLRRVTAAPLAVRLARLELVFWSVVLVATLTVLTAAVAQRLAPPAPSPGGRPLVEGRG
jgi:hypothetical protein